MTPFYLTGCLMQIVIHGTCNGYEPLVQFLFSIDAIFMLWQDSFLIYKTLRLLNFSKTICLLTSALIFTATNLCYYSLFHPTMSHVYSFFFLIAAFVYLSICLTQNTSNKYLLLSAIILGLIVLVRPPNIIIILFPLLLLGKQN